MSELPHNPIIDWRIRLASDADLPFVLSLTSRLSGVPRPLWHDLASMVAFQNRFMKATLQPPALGAVTYIAVNTPNDPVGYIHVEPGRDGVTDEHCAYVSLLAVKEEAEGSGIAVALVNKAEKWAGDQGYRLISLDVFATNVRAIKFYEKVGFAAETIRLVKRL
jgi:ribosomal protein S18 acetylase RimI-like enzyme